jgi:hypothetical protein
MDWIEGNRCKMLISPEGLVTESGDSAQKADQAPQ